MEAFNDFVWLAVSNGFGILLLGLVLLILASFAIAGLTGCVVAVIELLEKRQAKKERRSE